MNSAALTVCVYCGSRPGASPSFARAAAEVGTLIGQRGWRLVYGGGHVGLMGIAADATLQAGGEVVGVIPRALEQREVGHEGLTELHVVETMHQRKQLMAERSDVFLALPGGIGTMEELFEIWTWRQLGYHGKPLGLLNVAGFYDDLLRFLDRAAHEGFVSPETQELLLVGDSAGALLDRLASAAWAGPEKSSDYGPT